MYMLQKTTTTNKDTKQQTPIPTTTITRITAATTTTTILTATQRKMEARALQSPLKQTCCCTVIITCTHSHAHSHSHAHAHAHAHVHTHNLSCVDWWVFSSQAVNENGILLTECLSNSDPPVLGKGRVYFSLVEIPLHTAFLTTTVPPLLMKRISEDELDIEGLFLFTLLFVSPSPTRSPLSFSCFFLLSSLFLAPGSSAFLLQATM